MTKSKLVSNSPGKSLPQREREEENLVVQELKILQAEVFLRGLLGKPGNATGRKGHAEMKRWLASEWEKLSPRDNEKSDTKAEESIVARRRNTEGTAEGQVGVARKNPLVEEDLAEKIRTAVELLATSHLRSLDDKGRSIIRDRLDKIMRQSQKARRRNFVRGPRNTTGDGNSTSEERKDLRMRKGDGNSTLIERTRERFINLLDEYTGRSGITNPAKSPLPKEDQRRERSSAFLLTLPRVSGISYYSGYVYCSFIIILYEIMYIRYRACPWAYVHGQAQQRFYCYQCLFVLHNGHLD